VIHTASNNKLL